MRVIGGAGGYTPAPDGEPNHYVDHLRTAALSLGTYSVPAGGVDDQRPHAEDEVYVVTAGSARVVAGGDEAPVGPGSVVFVPAGEDHRFVDVTEDLALLVFFAPPYSGRADE